MLFSDYMTTRDLISTVHAVTTSVTVTMDQICYAIVNVSSNASIPNPESSEGFLVTKGDFRNKTVYTVT